MVRTHPDPPLVCDNRRMTALSHRLHTRTYAAQCSALSCLVLTDQCSRNGVMNQARTRVDGLREASSARRECPPHSGSYARMRATPQCAAYRRPAKGGLAQLGEHLLCKQGVVGSIPSSSTNSKFNRLLAQGSAQAGFWASRTLVGCCSLTIHRVESASSAESRQFKG